MNTLSTLTKIVTKSKKRVGRGYGSGKGGHTTGKGAKGQKVRTKIKLTNDGSKIKKSWLKRLPFLKGKGRNKTHLENAYIIKLSAINKGFNAKDTIDLKTLSKLSKIPVVDLEKNGLKILSDVKKIEKALLVSGQVKMSRHVKTKIIAAGGKII